MEISIMELSWCGGRGARSSQWYVTGDDEHAMHIISLGRNLQLESVGRL
jgi:hypothetical protein